MINIEKELRWANALDRMEARAETIMAAGPTSEQVRDLATMLLFSLWETDDDPTCSPPCGRSHRTRTCSPRVRASAGSSSTTQIAGS